ncbi:uncharacterized mitochondrial protein AtMg00810-like [Hibiscus syriacus]|uniref:uncharacterized mitochondrial protein AtMg00810-like n=1 Tax=Hibiscus syriacus TaxID=106335 RepID=UPI0019234D02|nr:uncharacterized mitochondrial protein AtMg00810-like [Hibiscus syriacus]
MKLTEALLSVDFQHSKFDYSIFTKRKCEIIVMLLIYEDDLLIIGNSEELIVELKEILKKSFKMKDLGNLKYFLGFEILRSKEGILINQRKYTIELIEDARLGGAKLTLTPLEQNLKLISTMEHDEEEQQDSSDLVLKDISVYQRLIGRLLYQTHTRSDITFVVKHLSQFMQQPKTIAFCDSDTTKSKSANLSGQGLMFEAVQETNLVAFCDSDWASL